MVICHMSNICRKHCNKKQAELIKNKTKQKNMNWSEEICQKALDSLIKLFPWSHVPATGKEAAKWQINPTLNPDQLTAVMFWKKKEKRKKTLKAMEWWCSPFLGSPSLWMTCLYTTLKYYSSFYSRWYFNKINFLHTHIYCCLMNSIKKGGFDEI